MTAAGYGRVTPSDPTPTPRHDTRALLSAFPRLQQSTSTNPNFQFPIRIRIPQTLFPYMYSTYLQVPTYSFFHTQPLPESQSLLSIPVNTPEICERRLDGKRGAGGGQQKVTAARLPLCSLLAAMATVAVAAMECSDAAVYVAMQEPKVRA
ncbi:hypothetical protein BZA05DRAFT_399127 [Tricharina praecox]|uniref:uncharacterized protein n=1 Tax=Tricharina praecox TaxID=43433 RepID=UPI0022203839|nr:uncharacterized protein BZA05DRAFT_399127 [Tricharina praecox]KAI5850898.1 hypothetical protein BZA05DRAFT_399127 [Tricharina praecox]